MLIQLTPQRRDEVISISVKGDALTINGEEFDFGPLPDGATLPLGSVDSEYIVGPVSREAGRIKLLLLLPHGPDPAPETAFPSDIVDPPDGPVTLPGQDWIIKVAEEMAAKVEGSLDA